MDFNASPVPLFNKMQYDDRGLALESSSDPAPMSAARRGAHSEDADADADANANDDEDCELYESASAHLPAVDDALGLTLGVNHDLNLRLDLLGQGLRQHLGRESRQGRHADVDADAASATYGNAEESSTGRQRPGVLGVLGHGRRIVNAHADLQANADVELSPTLPKRRTTPKFSFGNSRAQLDANLELERRRAREEGRPSRHVLPAVHEQDHMIDNSTFQSQFEGIVRSQTNALDAPDASLPTLTSKGFEMFRRLGYGQLVSLTYEELVIVFAYAKCWWSMQPSTVAESEEGLGDFARRMLSLREEVDAGDGTVPFEKIEAAFELEKLRINELSTMLLVHQLARAPVPKSERDQLLELQASRDKQHKKSCKRKRGSHIVEGAAGRGDGSGGGGCAENEPQMDDGGVDAAAVPEIEFESDLCMMESRLEFLARVLTLERSGARLYAASASTFEAESYLDPLRAFGADAESNSSYHTLIRYLCSRALEMGLRKRGRFIYKQKWSPLLYTTHGGRKSYPTHAWEEAMPIVEWVKRETAYFTNKAMWRAANEKGNAERAANYFETGIDPEIPVYKPDRHFFSFRNGIFWIGAPRAPTWFYYGDPKIPKFATSCKYHDRVFPAKALLKLLTGSPLREAYLAATRTHSAASRAASQTARDAKIVVALKAAAEAKMARSRRTASRVDASFETDTDAGAEMVAESDDADEQEMPSLLELPFLNTTNKKRRRDSANASPHRHADARAGASVRERKRLRSIRMRTDPVDIEAMLYENPDLEPMEAETLFHNYELIPTPALDSILLSQVGPDTNDKVGDNMAAMAILRVMYAMFGRLLFDLNEYDHWEVTMNLIGRAGAGKSTIINAITRLFDVKDVGTLANNANERFALQNLLDKMLIVCYEMTEKFGLDPSMWNSMVTGESVTAQVKAKDDVTIYKWLTPMLVAGNEMSGSVDKSGAKIRRCFIFFFDSRVPAHKQDPQLDKAIMEEMPMFLAKIAIAYREMAARFGSFSIWAKNVPVYGLFNRKTGECIKTGECSVLPEYFHKAKERLAATSHPLAAFLTNEEKLTLCGRADDAFGMPFTRFKEMADSHIKANHLTGISWKESNYADKLEDRGLKLITITSALLVADPMRYVYKGTSFGVGTQWVLGVMETDELTQKSLIDYEPLTTEEAELRANLYAAQKEVSKTAADSYRADALRLAQSHEHAKEADLADAMGNEDDAEQRNTSGYHENDMPFDPMSTGGTRGPIRATHAARVFHTARRDKGRGVEQRRAETALISLDDQERQIRARELPA